MDQYPPVSVQQITLNQAHNLSKDYQPKDFELAPIDAKLNLDENMRNLDENMRNTMLSSCLANILEAIRDDAQKVFLLNWEGNKVPRGAVVMGNTIAGTQHGMVTSDQSKRFATYERLIEFGGKSGKLQVMLVYV